MRDDHVVLPKDKVAQAKGLCSARTRHFKILAAPHGKKETKEIILLESNHERTRGHTGAHSTNLIDRDAFLVVSAVIKVCVTSMKALKKEGLFP